MLLGRPQVPPKVGNGKGHGNQIATGKGNGGTQNVPRGSGESTVC